MSGGSRWLPAASPTRVGGLFLLLPPLARLDLDTVVAGCKFPGTKMLPAAYAVRAALVLKLLGKARRSHVMDLLFDEGIALAVGLNAVPKTAFMAQCSSRLGRKAIVRLLGAWIAQLRIAGSSGRLGPSAAPCGVRVGAVRTDAR
jgi:hypothetical protein